MSNNLSDIALFRLKVWMGRKITAAPPLLGWLSIALLSSASGAGG